MSSCVICKVVTTKYRCPNCFERYCSVACCKAHKESCVKKENDVKNDVSTPVIQAEERASVSRERDLLVQRQQIENNSDDKVPDKLLQQLENSSELKDTLSNPHLRAILENLVNADNPEAAMAHAMHEPIFSEFADVCLQIVDRDNPNVEQCASVQ